MDFIAFLSLIPKIVNSALPGEVAHLKMAPPERGDLIKAIDFSTHHPRRAAVLMLVFPDNGKSCLTLIRRNAYKGVHSSQIAFPGGKIEQFDETPLSAALRETYEEVGIPPHDPVVVCPFSDVYIPPSNFLVSPYLAYLPEKPEFVPDPREVVQVLSLPLETLLDDSVIILRTMATSYSTSIDVPVFLVGDDAVWGATAMMLSELKEVLKTASS